MEYGHAGPLKQAFRQPCWGKIEVQPAKYPLETRLAEEYIFAEVISIKLIVSIKLNLILYSVLGPSLN